ncbi:hypothetical protein [Devriesea agamarum]|uniref:hypothetical protein n=1 Tax=Devriesea agamarum TaxID=472569 RepID=UPI00071C5159|nr:hypothetical protein [Devriesea agamarum]
MRKVLAAVAIVIGLIGIAIGVGGQTVWAPPREHRASVTIKDPGPAVLIDPGVLYVGGAAGTLTVTAPDGRDVVMTTAANGDITQWLGETRYTRVSGVPTWETLSTVTEHPKGSNELPDPKASDLWRHQVVRKGTLNVSIAEFAQEEGYGSGKLKQPFRSVLLTTDGKQPAPGTITISWKSNASNSWVPFAYVIGALLIVGGIAVLVIEIRKARRGEDGSKDDKSGATGPNGDDADSGADSDSDASDESSDGSDKAVAPSLEEGTDTERDKPADGSRPESGAKLTPSSSALTTSSSSLTPSSSGPSASAASSLPGTSPAAVPTFGLDDDHSGDGQRTPTTQRPGMTSTGGMTGLNAADSATRRGRREGTKPTASENHTDALTSLPDEKPNGDENRGRHR